MAALGFLFLALAVTQGALAPFEHCSEPANDGVYIVLFYPEVAPDCTSTAAAEKWLHPIIGNAEVHHAYSFSDFRGIAVHMNISQIDLLRQEPAVRLVEENCIYHLPSFTVQEPVEVDGLPGWGQYRVDQNTATVDRAIPFAPPTTDAASGAFQRNVYIVDTGVLLTHNEFKTPDGKSRAIFGTVTVPGGNQNDQNGHGTHVAGTCCGLNAGFDPTANIIAVKVLNAQGSGTTTGILNGIDWVNKNKGPGTNLISMSLGGSGTSLNAGVTSSFNNGINCIVAAGNDGLPADNSTPCNAVDSICVGSSNEANELSSFSNYGTFVDIIAPGSNILSSYNTADNAYAYASGTSMATPAVTGVSSVIAYQNPTMANTANLRGTLVNCATKNALNLMGKPDTVNYLLYDKCVSGSN